MMRRYLLPLLAMLGIVVTVIAVIIDSRPAPRERPAIEPPAAPYASYVAGTGIIEGGNGDIAIGTPVPGIVTEVYVKPGSRVRRGDRLFKVDDRDLKAARIPAMARKQEAQARLDQARALLEIGESVRDRRAISEEELVNRRSAVRIAEAAVCGAEADLQRIRLEMARRTVPAPSSGVVVAIGIRPGEFAGSGGANAPLMVLANESRLYLRVDIDEYDAWRVRRGAAATAFVRGNPALRTDLRFEWIEPYVVPKTSLTGKITERVDVRVLQVIYSFSPANLPHTYAGQQMDVFIAAPPPAAVRAGQVGGRRDRMSP